MNLKAIFLLGVAIFTVPTGASTVDETLHEIFPDQKITEIQELTSGLSGVEVYAFDLDLEPFILRNLCKSPPSGLISV